MRREACAACGGTLRDFLDLGSSPPANRFPATADEPETWYPLQAAVCTSCWLAQLREVVPDDELYGEDYGFRTGSSPMAVKYFGELAHELMPLYPAQAAQLTVEIACNDGTLLKPFADFGWPVLGVEPVKPAADEAAARGMDVIAEPFTAKLAEEIRETRGPAGLVLAFNVIAHVTDPLDFLAGVSTLLCGDGVAVIEFQDCEKLVAGCQVDHVYHEHRFFYSLRSFARVAQLAGLGVLDWEPTPAQGGSLRVTLAPCGRELRPGSSTFRPGGSPWLDTWEPYAGMQDRALYARRQLVFLAGAERAAGRVVAGYAASAKAVTLLNFCGLGPRAVKWIEDLTPGKVGLFMPGSHIPVREPGQKPDTYLVFAWNYLPDVLRREREFLDGGGKLIIPGPVPVLI